MSHPFYQVDIDGALRESPMAQGWLYGYGVFTTFRVVPGLPIFRLEAHYQRLQRDCGILAIRCPWADFAAFESMVARIREPLPDEERVIRVTVTANTLDSDLALYEPFVHVMIRHVPAVKSPVSLGFARFNRLLPMCKHMSHVAESVYLRQIRADGFDDLLRVSEAGYLTEAAYANVFWFTADGVIQTPLPQLAGCLPGIMRQAVLEACRAMGIRTEEGQYPPEVLREAQGVFLTNAIRGMLPVARIADHPYDVSRVAPLLEQIRAHLV